MLIEGTHSSMEQLYQRLNVDRAAYERDSIVDLFGRFFGVHEALVFTLEEEIMRLEGFCAWSVEYSFLEDHQESPQNLLSLSKELMLTITVKSLETGLGFNEHYVIENGEIVLNKCIHLDDEEFYDEEGGLRDGKEDALDAMLVID